MAGGGRFDLFITDLFLLYNRLAQEIGRDPPHVIAASRRAVAVLRAYGPEDDGDSLLIEVAIEQFEDPARRASGGPRR